MTDPTQLQAQLRLRPTPKLLELLAALHGQSQFQELMGYLEARCTGLAVQGHSVPDETLRLWVGGRVQELSDLLWLYHHHRALTAVPEPASPPAPGGFS